MKKCNLLFFLGLFSCLISFAQQPSQSDKAYILKDSLWVLGDDYILKSPLNNPNSFKISHPISSYKGTIKTLELIAYKEHTLFIDPATNAVYKAKKDSISLMIAASLNPHVGATYLVHNDTLFSYGGQMGLMNIDYFSFLSTHLRKWVEYPAYKSKYTPIGSLNNYYVTSEKAVVFFKGARINRRNLSDQYLDDHIIKYEWSTNEWEELGHARPDYKVFEKSISMGREILFYNEKNMFKVSPFLNNNSLYKRGLQQQNMNKKDQLDALFYKDVFYSFIEGSNGIMVIPVQKDIFLGGVQGVDTFYDLPEKSPFLLYVLAGFFVLSLALFKPLKNILIKEKIKLEFKGIKFLGVLHPIEEQQYNILKLLLSKPHITTAELMLEIENPNISYSQNMKIKNQLIEQINIILKTILNISSNIILDVKDKNDQRVTLYSIDKQFFKS